MTLLTRPTIHSNILRLFVVPLVIVAFILLPRSQATAADFGVLHADLTQSVANSLSHLLLADSVSETVEPIDEPAPNQTTVSPETSVEARDEARADADSTMHIHADSVIDMQSKDKSGNAMMLDAEVKYEAKDSMWFDFEKKKMYLYGDAKIDYGDISLTAYNIELDMDSSLAYACGRVDSLGNESGLPVFKDKSGEYTMKELKYNFETKKAIITHIVTEQGEGFVVGQRAKRVDEKTYFMKDAKYTTCNEHEHPHFYLNLTKAKVIPGKRTVTGPAYLVLLDVPLPLAIPFAIIPNTKSYSSGIVMPTFGDESTRGFYLRNGGYYWAASQYFDLKILGDVYTKGSWGLHVSSVYKKRYKFSGSFSTDIISNVTSEKSLPDYAKSNDFSVRWNHSQDSKANPDQTFSASVNFSTSSYNKNNVGNVVNPTTLSTNQKSSSISYSRKWQGNPFRMTLSVLHSQNSRDTSISLTLPDLSLTSSKRFYPFKPKKGIASNTNPLHNLNLNYSMSMKNSISCKESELTFKPESFSTKWRNGMKHTVPLTTNIKVLKYFTLSPSVNYTERWYLSKTRKHWDEEAQKIVKEDPETGFNRAYDFSMSVGTSTKIYTFYKPIRALFGDKINAIRHVMTPSVSVSYTPDFSQPKYGFYDQFEYYDKSKDEVVTYKYSLYDGYLYGTPGSAKSGKLSFSLGNTLEMKVKSDEDTTGFKKISILESLSLSSGYDFMKDTLRFDNITMSGRTKIFGTSVNFSALFDPYGIVASPKGQAIRVNRSAIKQNHRFLQFKSASLSFGLQFSPDTFKKKDKDKQNEDDEEEDDGVDEDWAIRAAESDTPEAGAQMDKDLKADNSLTDEGYAAFDMPWSLSLNYSLRVSQGTFKPETCSYVYNVSQSLNVSGSLALTSKWKFSVSTGYSFDEHKLSQTSIGITRDLHCWSMAFNVVPVGLYKSYSFNISVSSSMLRDLKYEQNSSPRDNGRFR